MSYLDVPFPLSYYCKTKRCWPEFGNHIIGTYNSRNIILYLSVPRSIGVIASAYQNFRKHCNHLRIDWTLTPTFLSAVNASKWATYPDQDCLLALTVSRRGFEDLLHVAANSKYSPRPTVKFAWEPDRDPFGMRLRRFALQLRLKNEMVDTFLDEMVLRIDDVTSFVRREKCMLFRTESVRSLMIPHERTYEPISYYLSRDLEIDKGFPSERALGACGGGGMLDDCEC